MIIRHETPEDIPAIADLNDRAFGETTQSRIIAELRDEDQVVSSWLAIMDEKIVGHLLFYTIGLDGQDITIGLGPVCVSPDHQKSGIGSALIEHGLSEIDRQKYLICFLLGHVSYYPRFGFSSELGAQFVSPWHRPAFMGLSLTDDAPKSGTLTFPKAYL